MDAAWLVIDSLSMEATPFVDQGPNTMPQIKSLASEHATVFTKAYAPGPTSPSSHSSFFTGELPSKTGMHEATPYYSGEYKTIIQALSDTHRTFMCSANPFIFNGLDSGLDKRQDLIKNDYMFFNDATSPHIVAEDSQASKPRKILRTIFQDGKPLRSFINGLSYVSRNRLSDAAIPKFTKQDDEMYQYVNSMNNDIRSFLQSSSNDGFVIANYMDVHAPLDASKDAISRFTDTPKSDLPVGVRGQDIHEKVKGGDTQIGEDMYDLYKAAIYDVDRKLSGLVEELIKNDTFVIITADHGNWFRRERDLEERRIHVPLIIFSPTEPGGKTIEKTVNLRSMPRTTMKAVLGDNGDFKGVDLCSVTTDQLSVTEFIHDPDTANSPVTPDGNSTARYDFALIENDTRLDYIDGEFIVRRGEQSKLEELRKVGQELVNESFERGANSIDISKNTEEHLRDLGYMN